MVDHKDGGKVRIDATITYRDDSHEIGVYAHEDKAYNHDNYFKVYQPQFDDHGYVCADEDEMCLLTPDPITEETVAWWKLSCGRVLGVVNGMMLEFDKSTLAPLGLVVSGDMLLGKQVECRFGLGGVHDQLRGGWHGWGRLRRWFGDYG